MKAVKKIALDVDGVILDFGRAYVKAASEVLQRPIAADYSKYKLQDFLQVSQEEDLIVWNYFNEKNYWKDIEPFANVEKALKKIISYDYEIYIVTAINPMHEKSRLENLKKLGLIPEEIHCVGENNAHKHEYLSVIKPHVFVDDRLDHLYRSLEIPHMGWINHNQLQVVEFQKDITHVYEISSLYDWTEKYLDIVTQQIENTAASNRIKFK